MALTLSDPGYIDGVPSKFSDLTISCGGVDLLVHKVHMCTASKVMERAVEGRFKEGATGVIVVEEFDADTMKKVIRFVYTDKYNVPGKEQDSNPETVKANLLSHLRVNAAADYYDIEPLKLETRERVKAILGSQRLWSPDYFPAVLKEAEERNGDKDLLRILHSTTSEHIEQLLRIDEFNIPYAVIRGYLMPIMNKLDSQAKKAEREREAEKRERAKADREKEQAEKETKRLRQERNQLKQEKTQLTQEIAKLKQEKTELEKEREELQDDMDELKDDRDDILHARDKLKREKEAIRRDRDTIKRERDHTRRRVDYLEREWAQMFPPRIGYM